ncbi:hypothetical protein Tco_1571597, partial [Tanacetum coccineum]
FYEVPPPTHILLRPNLGYRLVSRAKVIENQASTSPDYVSGPEYPPSPDFVPKPVYPEFMPPEDEVLLAEEQPLLIATLPTANSPGYVPEGDDGDDEDESSDDEEDDDVDIKEDEEVEEHPAPADSTAVALPPVDHAPSAEETKPFETDESAATPPPHPAYQVTARISIRDEPPTTFWSDTEIPSPPLPPILSPLPVSPPLLVSSPPPASPIRPLGYRAAMIWLRAEASSTSHSLPLPPPIILSHTRLDAPSSGTPPLLPIPLPTSSPPLHLLSTDRRVDRPEVTLPPQKRLGIALGLRYEVGESLSAPTARPPRGFRADYGFVTTIDREIIRDLKSDVSYGITDTWDEILVDMPGVPATDDTELGRRMTEFTIRVRQDTDEIYTRLDDKQSERQLSAGCSMDVSDLARAEVMSLRTQVVAQHAVIRELQTADRKRQAAITKMLAADRRRQAQFIEALKLLKRLQTQMTEFKR